MAVSVPISFFDSCQKFSFKVRTKIDNDSCQCTAKMAELSRLHSGKIHCVQLEVLTMEFLRARKHDETPSRKHFALERLVNFYHITLKNAHTWKLRFYGRPSAV